MHEKVNYYAAKMKCRRFGGELATRVTEEEHAKLKENKPKGEQFYWSCRCIASVKRTTHIHKVFRTALLHIVGLQRTLWSRKSLKEKINCSCWRFLNHPCFRNILNNYLLLQSSHRTLQRGTEKFEKVECVAPVSRFRCRMTMWYSRTTQYCTIHELEILQGRDATGWAWNKNWGTQGRIVAGTG